MITVQASHTRSRKSHTLLVHGGSDEGIELGHNALCSFDYLRFIVQVYSAKTMRVYSSVKKAA